MSKKLDNWELLRTQKRPEEVGTIVAEEGDISDPEENISMDEQKEFESVYLSRFSTLKEGQVVKGRVVAVGTNDVMVDIGFKSDGILPLDEFAGENQPKVGDEIDIFLDALEDENGQVVISKKKADFLRVWNIVKEACDNGTPVKGKIKRRIKGGMVVDIMGVDAFLPGSQIYLRQIPDFDTLIGKELDFRVIKVNKVRRNIIVSHRILLEEERDKRRNELLGKIEEGQVVEGIVKNITDFGVFIDLGGMDGLLHITDMSWSRINHPSELVRIGDKIKVMVLKFDKEKQRISLGLKQLTPSPWDNIDQKYPPNKRVKGRVISLTKYGAFVRLEEGVEGLIHISEMSWTKQPTNPGDILEIGQEVECVVLSADKENHKISLGIKQLTPNPWDVLASQHPKGSHITGVVRNMTAFGAFVEVAEGIEGLIHISDISWTKRVNHPSEFFKKGQKITAVVLEIDPQTQKLALGYKQLQPNPWAELAHKYAVGTETEGRITRMTDKGVIVELPGEVDGFVPVTQLGKRVDRPQDAFSVNDILPLKVLEFDGKEHRIVLSVDAYFESREKEDLERYLAAHPIKTVKVEEIAKVTRKTYGEEVDETDEENMNSQ